MKNIFLIPTDKPSRLCKDELGKFYLTEPMISKITFFKNQHIYITSDEVIEDDDYALDTRNNVVLKQHTKQNNTIEDLQRGQKRYIFRIILTTDSILIKYGVQPIDDDFLEWFCKNSSCDEIEVEREMYMPQSNGKISDGKITHEISLDSSQNTLPYYKIIIPSTEIWKDVPEFEGYYQLSNLGNVKSLSRTILGRGKHNTLLKERILKFSTSANGYYQVILQKEGFKKIYKVHSLVAICFFNHTPDGTHNVVIDHINEVKTDNRLENLRLIGHRENVSRSMKNNTSTYVGVSWSKNAKKWISQITIEGKTKYLGLFDNEEDANKKYLETLQDL